MTLLLLETPHGTSYQHSCPCGAVAGPPRDSATLAILDALALDWYVTERGALCPGCAVGENLQVAFGGGEKVRIAHG